MKNSEHNLDNLPATVEGWEKFHERLKADLNPTEYLHTAWILSRTNLYFLLRFILSAGKQKDKKTGVPLVAHQFIHDRAIEVQNWCHETVDIWARYHYKSTIKSYALPIQILLNDPEATICVLSYNKPVAKSFLRVVKSELEHNQLLKELSWDPKRGEQTFFDDPKLQSERWTLDDGMCVNRKNSSDKAGSLEGFGLVDSQPIGKHFSVLLFDDVVIPASVLTPEANEKTTAAFNHSLNLGHPGTVRTVTGTFHSHDDTYNAILAKGWDLRLHPCYKIDKLVIDEESGGIAEMTYTDEPALYDKDYLEKEKLAQGPLSFGIQMLANPLAGLTAGFQLDWIKYYDEQPEEVGAKLNKYILVDPADNKKQSSSYTSIWVVGVDGNENMYILDGVHDRLNLEQRTDALFGLHKKWRPVQEVRYEQYAFQADIPHINYVMRHRNYNFFIQRVGGVRVSKDDRIGRLVPLFSAGRVYLPRHLYKARVGGDMVDLVSLFIREEYLKWPSAGQNDMLDALSRMCEPDLPVHYPDPDITPGERRYYDKEPREQTIPWMSVA